jgi:hypothetical protein
MYIPCGLPSSDLVFLAVVRGCINCFVVSPSLRIFAESVCCGVVSEISEPKENIK